MARLFKFKNLPIGQKKTYSASGRDYAHPEPHYTSLRVLIIKKIIMNEVKLEEEKCSKGMELYILSNSLTRKFREDEEFRNLHSEYKFRYKYTIIEKTDDYDYIWQEKILLRTNSREKLKLTLDLINHRLNIKSKKTSYFDDSGVKPIYTTFELKEF